MKPETICHEDQLNVGENMYHTIDHLGLWMLKCSLLCREVTYPQITAGTFESMIFLFPFGGICDRSLGYLFNISYTLTLYQRKPLNLQFGNWNSLNLLDI